MDTKLKLKEEKSLLDNVVPQNETEFLHKVVSMQQSSDAVLLKDCCDVPVETEIKSEAPFTKHFIKWIKSEAVTCSRNWEIDRKAVIDEQTLISDFGSQSEGELLSEGPVTKLGIFNTSNETGNKIKIKDEPLWPEIETSATCDDIKDGDLPPVNILRLCAEGISSAVSGKSPFIAAKISERDTIYTRKDNPNYERQKSDVIKRPSAEEHVLSEQSGKCSEGGEMCMRSLDFKQKTSIRKSIKSYKCKTCHKSFSQLSHLKSHYFETEY